LAAGGKKVVAARKPALRGGRRLAIALKYQRKKQKRHKRKQRSFVHDEAAGAKATSDPPTDGAGLVVRWAPAP
jgi:hypothetical protein